MAIVGNQSAERIKRAARRGRCLAAACEAEANQRSWVEGAKTTHEKLRKLGVASKLTVLPRDGHVPETLFGDRFMNHMNKVRRKLSGDVIHASRTSRG